MMRFARWDGGRIETAKAFLSGWPGFNPPAPDQVESMTNWYTPRTIELLREAGINTIWVTFSNGFSIETERAHMAQLKEYIARCHAAGIRVLAYQSIANLFWEDMFEKVPESKEWVRTGADGKPTPYGAAAYKQMGRVTRYMARISHPGWQEYLLKRVELSLDAGADGIFYDNNFNEALPETYQRVYEWASSRKRDVLLMGNFHSNSYVMNRLTNAMSTEDGWEPGVYADGRLVNNIGLFRLHQGLSGGWKPVLIEHGHREVGDRFSNPISPRRHQLAIAEAAACGASFEVFSEGSFADGLWRGKPEAMENWRAIAQYNRFLADNQELYAGAENDARVTVMVDDSGKSVAALNALAARNVMFRVVYGHDRRGEAVVEERPLVRVEGSSRVLATVTRQKARQRRMVHLLNYADKAAEGLKVTVDAACGRITLLSPDAGRTPAIRTNKNTARCLVEIPRIERYSVLVMDGV